MDTVNLAVADAMSRNVDELTRLHQLLHQEPHVRGLGYGQYADALDGGNSRDADAAAML